ncbi:MAG: hypothetical protein ACXACX_15665 [Candidatus Hodarchaeales archaeon]|jgi:hypothetical protein
MEIKTRGDMDKIPENWYMGIERSRKKANALIKKIVAVDQSTSIVVGKLENVELDRLWRLKFPYCKLVLRNAVKFNRDGNFNKMDDTELMFVNKPKMVLDLAELKEKYPKVFDEVDIMIKTDKFD